MSRTQIHTSEFAPIYKGKTILITGSVGTVGSEVLKQILKYDPAEVRRGPSHVTAREQVPGLADQAQPADARGQDRRRQAGEQRQQSVQRKDRQILEVGEAPAHGHPPRPSIVGLILAAGRPGRKTGPGSRQAASSVRAKQGGIQELNRSKTRFPHIGSNSGVPLPSGRQVAGSWSKALTGLM